jgi:TonB family protein
MSETKKALLVPLFVSLLLHLILFVGLSLNFLWPKSVSANKPVSVRIVSIDLPKPKENIPPNPDSRFISDANRKESGKGKPSDRPKLRREIEERLPARRGENAPEVATLARPPSAKFLPEPPPPEPTPVEPTPPKPEVVEQPTPEPVKPPEPEVVEKPEPEPVKPPEPEVVEQSTPEPVKPPEPEVVEKPEPEPVKQPEPRVVKKAKPIPRKPVPPRKKAVRPKKRPPKRVRVASLPKPRPKPRPTPPKIQRRPPPPKPAPRRRAKPIPKSKPPVDPLAMFRRQKNRGRPDSNRLKLSDEEADRIAKASLEKSLREEEGEAVSLDTRNYKYAAYFAHIKKRIQESWHWPPEARKYFGKLKLKFVLRDDGKLHRVELLSSSKYKILDDEALSAIAKAAPFRRFPPAFKRKLLPIEAVFSYENSSRIGYR